MIDEAAKIWVLLPAAIGVAAEEKGEIVRVVGNSIAYVNLPSGSSFAFSAEDIEKYAGQSLSSLGVREGVSVYVKPNAEHITVRLNQNSSVSGSTARITS